MPKHRSLWRNKRKGWRRENQIWAVLPVAVWAASQEAELAGLLELDKEISLLDPEHFLTIQPFCNKPRSILAFLGVLWFFILFFWGFFGFFVWFFLIPLLCKQQNLNERKWWDLWAQHDNKSLLKCLPPWIVWNFNFSHGVELSSSGYVACEGRDRGWWVISAKLKAELAVCGCAAVPFPAWSRCLAAWFSGNINLVLPWLQELLRHGIDTWAEDENNSFHHLFGLGEAEVVQGLLRDHCTSPLLCLLRSVFFLKFSFL